MKIATAFLEHGIDNFRFEVVEECSADILSEREIWWIAKLRPEYNVASGGIPPRVANAAPRVPQLPIYIPRTLHRVLKSRCHNHGKPIQEVVGRIVREWLTVPDKKAFSNKTKEPL